MNRKYREVKVTMTFRVETAPIDYAWVILRQLEEAINAVCVASTGTVNMGRVERAEFGDEVDE